MLHCVPAPRTKIQLVLLMLGCLLVTAIGCGSVTPSANQPSPTLAPANIQEPTAIPVGSPAPTKASAPTQAAQPTSAPAATTAPATSAPPASGAGALDVILEAQRAQSTAKSFRSTNVTTTSDGKTTTIVTEFVAPDRIHMIQSSSLNNLTTETIIIKGKGTWRKAGAAQWVKSGFDMSDLVFSFLDPKNLEQLKGSIKISTLQLAGAEVLNGKPTLVYQYNTELPGTTAESTIKGTFKIWVGATDRRAYKLEGDTDSIVNKGAKIHTVVTYEYDLDIKIEQPIP